ncbi:MAG: hypothetical protein V7776_04965 [Halopseudomonas aestusnigri]
MACSNRVDWKVRSGAALIKTLRVKQNGLPVNLTGQTIKCIITDFNGNELKDLTPALEITRVSGEIIVKISSVITLGLPVTSHLFYLDIADDPEYFVNFVTGDLTVFKGAT